MRIVHGAEAGRRALKRGRGPDLGRIPPGVEERTARALGRPMTPVQAVEHILDQVRRRGDDALRELTLRLDGVESRAIEVTREVVAAAYDEVPKPVVEAIREAARRVRRFHERAMPRGWWDEAEGYGQVLRPMGRVGVYVPGGTAPLFSTAIMTVVPAKVAGVREVVVCSPPGPDGWPSPALLVAADIAGADRVFALGGAQAIGAMAYGTESVPPVDLVCGPGNLFVTLAKKLVYGDVGVDGLFGPTETLLVADGTANPTLCAADLLAQAEHDPLARPVLITTSRELAQQVRAEVMTRLARLERGAIARPAVEGQGCIVVVDDLDTALTLANEFAPEHLSLMVREPSEWLDRVSNAGVVFLGEFSHEVLGDYVAGPSHVMPTGGTARFGSGVGVHTFLRWLPVVGLDRERARELTRAASVLGRAEGLTAHAEAAEIREELP